jgi:hypothetical protein
MCHASRHVGNPEDMTNMTKHVLFGIKIASLYLGSIPSHLGTLLQRSNDLAAEIVFFDIVSQSTRS